MDFSRKMIFYVSPSFVCYLCTVDKVYLSKSGVANILQKNIYNSKLVCDNAVDSWNNINFYIYGCL